MKKSPVAFFAYKRPKHTLRSLESLAENEGAQDTELFIFCDAPKKPEDLEAVKEVREIVKSKQWCGSVQVIERETNWGLANSIIGGITELCQKYGKVIVIEDDLVLSPFFLDYMNRALERYQDSLSVMQISGHMFPVKLEVQPDAVFLPFVTSWGWATWERAWQHFNREMSGYIDLKKNKILQKKFNLNNCYPYFEMLELQIKGKIDSWAIRWYLSTFILDGLTLYPVSSLVSNIGFDSSGTHCQTDTFFEFDGIWQQKIEVFPSKIEEDVKSADIVFKYLKSRNYFNKSFFKTLFEKIKRAF